MTQFRSPTTVIGRFVARRTLKSAALWAFIFGVYMADKTLAFAKIAPDAATRDKVLSSFTNNVGLTALLGKPHDLTNLAGYANWNSLGVITIIASIWAFLAATKYFRGEEDNGRSELLLSGQTTSRRAAANILIGLMSSFVVMFVVTAVMFVEVGKVHTLNFSPSSSLFFALASVSGAALFMSIGALTSQIMPTRGRASSLAAAIFGIFFVIRAVGDITSASWLLNATPFGWIEKLQPLVGSQPIWLLPLFGSTLIISLAAIWLAGKRDLGEGLLPDKSSAKPKTMLLNSTFLAGFRLTRSTTIGWLAAISLMSVFYGILTKTASQAFGQSASFEKGINKVFKVAHFNVSVIYLGIVFFMMMALIMAYVANAVGKIREDESDGYTDNFLVRPVSRIRWLTERILLVALITVVASMLSAFCIWASQVSQDNGVSMHTLLTAGVNMIAPAIFTLGAGILTFGIRPRLTSFVTYGVLGWSFLLFLISSGLNINHWLLDTSVLHQVVLAPTANPNWKTDGILTLLGAALCGIGTLVFNSRDLQSE